jgi:hypothetical protein
MTFVTSLPAEADWDTAPGLLDGAMRLELTPQQCDLDYWLSSVAQGTLRGLVAGHRPEAGTPEHMRVDGPLRQALVSELGFRSVAEEKATRAISDLVRLAPDRYTMEFYATQLIDEARHSRVFRGHLPEMGIPESEVDDAIEAAAGADIRDVLLPLEEFCQPVRDAGDFIGGVVLLTILVEGVLAPTAELSERKWRRLDPAAAEIERGAGIDEIRHLTVGSAIVRWHLREHPGDASRLGDLIAQGQQRWLSTPVLGVLQRRETLFQEGLAAHAHLVGDYQIWPGRRLLDTTVQERIQQAIDWSTEMQQSRLAYMGLSEVGG